MEAKLGLHLFSPDKQWLISLLISPANLTIHFL